MAHLEFCKKHNMVAFLSKPDDSEDFHQIINFLSESHISYALTASPLLYKSLIDQFWSTAVLSSTEEGAQAITAVIDDREVIISEVSLRRHLKLQDSEGISSLPNEEIFEQLTNMGTKKTAWDQFSSNIATAIICLATSRRFNFSKFIFEGIVKNLNSNHKFFIYPRFIQIVLNKYKGSLLQHTRTYPTPTLTNKLFNNMRRPTKGSPGVITPLFATMLVQPQGETSTTSPSHISSSSYHSSEPTPDHTSPAEPSPSPIAPQHSQPSPAEEDHVSPPNESPLHVVHSHKSDEGSLKLHELTNLVTQLSDKIGVLETDLKTTKLTYSSAFTKLILRVKKLEKQVKTGKARRKAKIVLSEDEDVQDDSSKQGRMLSDDQEGVEWIPDVQTEVQDKEVQDKASDETELVVQEETPTEVIQDQESSEKGQSEVSTAGATGTASEVLIVSTAEVDISTAGRVVYSRRSSRETRQDKGKAILTELEPKKKSKKELEQERLSLAEAIRIQEQIDEEQRAQIARDEEIAKQWQEQERVESERVPTKEID
ncbi:hypothetical protein Tco_0975456 [Tanacetum coccineum]|uniref:Synaptobrevin, longin-like domain protein n=1 Tax=Tanacetum coccineum TaxID=301880 RepID=A0ABQ5EEG3_9ASTR